MRLFDRELQRRGAAERTRRAYGVDLGRLALWGSANGVEPSDVDHAVLLRYAAQLARRGAGPRAVARKLAAVRSFFTVTVTTTWSVSWVGAGGTGGALPAMT